MAYPATGLLLRQSDALANGNESTTLDLFPNRTERNLQEMKTPSLYPHYEFAVWGKFPPTDTDEQILFANYQGEPIETIQLAEKLAEVARVRGASQVRIQRIDLSDNRIYQPERD